MNGLGTVIKVLLIGLAALIVILIIVGIVSLGSLTTKSDRSSKQVTPTAFRLIKVGWRPRRVRALIGDPESTNVTVVQGLREECWVYGVLAANGTYSFCFSNGRLESKSRL